MLPLFMLRTILIVSTVYVEDYIECFHCLC